MSNNSENTTNTSTETTESNEAKGNAVASGNADAATNTDSASTDAPTDDNKQASGDGESDSVAGGADTSAAA